ncbi:hypothetical protein QE152_g26128 [Popillia japonica]|uniref:TIL domain-containing protein n=1 Tax=Popillia japonica TaxID=7064 RepID=A0AAW1JY93_POPJA
MKLVVIFIVVTVLLFKIYEGSVVWPLQQCGSRRIYNSCASNCQDVCKYGTHRNVTCAWVPLCRSQCVCAPQYVLDPRSNECWTRTYCTFKRKTSFILGIFGIKS